MSEDVLIGVGSKNSHIYATSFNVRASRILLGVDEVDTRPKSIPFFVHKPDISVAHFKLNPKRA